MGAPALYVHKCGRSRFKRSKLWELSFLSVQNMGVFVLSARKYGSCRLKLITQSVGALALSAQKYGSSRLIRPQVQALPF